MKRRTKAVEKKAFTIREAVEAGAGSRSVIYEALNAGTLKAKKRGKRTIILATDLAEYLEALPDFHEQAAA